MKTSTTTCDHCGSDLTTRCGGDDRFYLILGAAKIPNTSDMRFAMHYEPPISRDHHLCNWACLSGWIAMRSLPKVTG